MAGEGTHGREPAGEPSAEPVVPVLITTTGDRLVRIDMPDPQVTLSAERARQVARALLTAANQAGLEYQRTAGGHGRITDPNHPENGFVSIPTTPSDHRSWDNVLAEIRRRLHTTL